MSKATRTLTTSPEPLNPGWVEELTDEVEQLRRALIAIDVVGRALYNIPAAMDQGTTLRYLVARAFEHMTMIENVIPPEKGR